LETRSIGMDEKLETLIEKLSLLLNTPAKQPFETKPSTASTNLNKNAAAVANNSSKKPERLPELPPRKMVIDPPQQPPITHPHHLLNPSRPGKQREHETAISIQTNSNCTRSNLSCAQDWAKKSCASIRTSYRNLGVERADPHTYAQKYNSTLMYPNQMPEIADEVKIIHGIPLAADLSSKYYMELEGDIHALAMIDLDKEGLSEYKPYLQKIQTPPLPAIDHNTNKQTSAATTANTVASTIKSNLATDHKTVKQFSVSTMSSATISNNTSTSSISTTSSTPLNKSSSDSGSEKSSSENSSKQNSLKQKTNEISAALNCRLDASKACLKLKPQIEVETLKLEKPVPIVKHSFNVNNTRNYETDPKQIIKNQPRNTIINVPSNLNAIQRNAIIKKEQQQQQQQQQQLQQQQQVPVKQVHFKDPKRSPPVAPIPAAFGSTEYNKSSSNINSNNNNNYNNSNSNNNNNYSNSNSNKSNNNNNYANSGPRSSVATIIEANSIHNYALDKMTPLPTTPLPTPIRNMLNSISALNNKNYTVDTVPNTPAAFSTPLPVPVVSLPPLPLPMSKSPLNNSNNNNKNINHNTITATTANTNTNINTNSTLIKAATQSKLGSPSISNIKSPQDVKPPQNNQNKTKSPIKIGHTSLKQVSCFLLGFYLI